MASKKRKPKSLARPGEPSQKTRTGLEIPVPTRSELFGFLGKVIRKQKPSASPSKRARAKH
jgi:hypothetical protein